MLFRDRFDNFALVTRRDDAGKVVKSLRGPVETTYEVTRHCEEASDVAIPLNRMLGNLISPSTHPRRLLRHPFTQANPSFLALTAANKKAMRLPRRPNAHAFALLLAMTLGLSTYAQSLPGKLFFKIKPNPIAIGSEKNIPLYNSKTNDNIYNTFWQQAIKDYRIIQIEKPFKTDDAEVQKIYRVSFESYDSIYSFVKRLQSENYIEYAHPCPVYQKFSTPNDINSRQSWVFQTISMDNAWGLAGNNKSTIAVVDDGVKIDHPDLNIWTNPNEIDTNKIDDDLNGFVDDIHGYDVADNDNDPTPPASQFWTHGTHTSGIAGAKTNNNLGVASVSYNTVSIIAVKCTNQPVVLTNTEDGLDYAIKAGANIISMSWGGKDTSLYKTLHTLIDAAYKKNIILVAAAGNDGEDSVNYPAGFEHVISVGSTGVNDMVSKISNYGNYIDVMAPGDTIYSTVVYSPYYGTLSGTSMSCPLVAGLCGLMLSVKPTLTPDQIEICLKATADNIDSKNNIKYKNKLGAGRINAVNAMQCAINNSIQKKIYNNTITIWPNPVQNILNMSLPNSGKSNLQILDMMGKVVLYTSLNKSASIDLTGYAAGLYMINVYNENGLASCKFLKVE